MNRREFLADFAATAPVPAAGRADPGAQAAVTVIFGRAMTQVIRPINPYKERDR